MGLTSHSLVPRQRFEGLIYIIIRVLKIKAVDSSATWLQDTRLHVVTSQNTVYYRLIDIIFLQ